MRSPSSLSLLRGFGLNRTRKHSAGWAGPLALWCSITCAKAYSRWEERWADTRIHGATKRQVAAMFAEERPPLLQVPIELFRYYQYGERTVYLGGCVEVEPACYCTPPGWMGQRVHVQWNDSQVR